MLSVHGLCGRALELAATPTRGQVTYVVELAHAMARNPASEPVS